MYPLRVCCPKELFSAWQVDQVFTTYPATNIATKFRPLKLKWSSVFALVSNYFKPLSVTTNVVGLQTDDAGHVGQNSSTHVTRVVGLQTYAVVVTETRFRNSLNVCVKVYNFYSILPGEGWYWNMLMANLKKYLYVTILETPLPRNLEFISRR